MGQRLKVPIAINHINTQIPLCTSSLTVTKDFDGDLI